MTFDVSSHPCFNEEVKKKFGRIHLPVAPDCNIRCNFCDRKYNCVNESRPGITSTVLSPGQALEYLNKMVKRDNRLSVVGIAGPGDPFANPQKTLETLKLVRGNYPDMLLCVATNGLAAPSYIEEISKFNLTHLTVTINAVDPEIGAEVYGWIRDNKKIYRGVEGAKLILERQLETIRLCKEHGIITKINSIVIPGVNDHHIVDIAKKVSELGADLFNAIALCSVPGTPFGSIKSPTRGDIENIRRKARLFMPQMAHCTRCRADAVGCLGDKIPTTAIKYMKEAAMGPLNPSEERPYVAVASKEGMLVNEHLGQAKHLWIFGKTDKGYELIESRQTPPGGGDIRWQQLSGILRDCRILLTVAAGKKPTDALIKSGVRVFAMEGLIQRALEIIYEGGDLNVFKPAGTCGGCSGVKNKGCA